MGIRLRVDLEEMTWEELETIQEMGQGQVQIAALRKMLARYVVDEQGQPVEMETAMRELGKLKRMEMLATMKSFAEAIQVPKENGSG